MNFSNGKIYVIKSRNTDDVYVGSTTGQIQRRFVQHKADYNRWKAGKFRFITSFTLFEKGDCWVELLEEFPCNSQQELYTREGEIIKTLPNCINRRVAGRTDEQYRSDNLEQRKAKRELYAVANRKWYVANRDRVNALRRERRAKAKASVSPNCCSHPAPQQTTSALHAPETQQLLA